MLLTIITVSKNKLKYLPNYEVRNSNNFENVAVVLKKSRIQCKCEKGKTRC